MVHQAQVFGHGFGGGGGGGVLGLLEGLGV